MILRALTKNWALKLLAVALAFAIWVSVTGENRIVKDVEAPLQIGLSDNRILASTPPNTVTVRLSGPESLMRRLDPVPLVLRVEMEDTSFGKQDVQLLESHVSGVPRGLEIVFIDPDRVSLNVDRRLRRELPVETTFLGQPPEGFAFYGATVTPDKFVVEGPESEIRPLESAATNAIRLDQRRGPFVMSVSAVPVGPHVRVIGVPTVRVHVIVDASPVEMEFEEIPIVISGDERDAEIEPAAVRVTLSGPPAMLDAMEPGQVVAVADVSGLALEGDSHQVELRVEFQGVPPENKGRITVKSLSRRKVNVRFSEEGSEE